MSESIKMVVNDTDVSDMTTEEIQERYDQAVKELDNKLAEMQADVELLYQFRLNEVRDYFTSLLNKKKLETA